VSERDRLLATLNESLAALSAPRLRVLADIVQAFSVEMTTSRWADSDFASEDFTKVFGDVLLVHHTLSSDSFTKDKFEHGICAALNSVGISAELFLRGNPGADIRVRAEAWSLKTQADRNIRRDIIHISKFMELGQGRWSTASDLEGLRGRMFTHMENYDRIFTLRALSAGRTYPDDSHHEYELVEIPKSLLLRSVDFPCIMHDNSRQSPKPGSCSVVEADELLFELYFDGGTERKLQVRKLAKSACQVHASWRFPKLAQPT